MSRLATSFVLGYHGCDKEIADGIIGSETEQVRVSRESFDWLGAGAYFWEADPLRALEWARTRGGSRKLRHPYVIGAVIDLRNCLDLTVREDVALLARYYERLKNVTHIAGAELPQNEDHPADPSLNKLLRRLDCAVINFMHQEIERAANEALTAGQSVSLQPFDTVRGMFEEGAPAFDGAGLRAKTHTQIAVINPACVRGYFRPRPYPT